MSITATDKSASIQDTSNVTTYASPSFTPVANRLYLAVALHSDAAPEATVPTIATTTGLNFVQVGSSVPFNTIASNLHRLTVFRAMKASGLSTGTFTVTLGDAGTSCIAYLVEFDPVETSGTDGANAILQPTVNSGDSTANPSVTFLNAFSSASNGTFSALGSGALTAPTPTSGGTLVPAASLTITSPTGGLWGIWSAANDPAPAVTKGASNWGMIALEIVAAAAAGAMNVKNISVLQAVNRASTY